MLMQKTEINVPGLQTLIWDKKFKPWVQKYAKDEVCCFSEDKFPWHGMCLAVAGHTHHFPVSPLLQRSCKVCCRSCSSRTLHPPSRACWSWVCHLMPPSSQLLHKLCSRGCDHVCQS